MFWARLILAGKNYNKKGQKAKGYSWLLENAYFWGRNKKQSTMFKSVTFIVSLFLVLGFGACQNEAAPQEAAQEETAAASAEEQHGHHEGHGAAPEPLTEEGLHYGLEKIDGEGAKTAAEVVAALQAEDLGMIAWGEGQESPGVENIKVEGEIVAMCKMSGCWFTLKTAEGQELVVSTAEHKALPKEFMGQTVVAEGPAFRVDISAEELQAQAQADGQSEEEAAKITEGRSEFNLIAKGVMLKK